MDSTPRNVSHPRACRSCAHFKTKCIPHQDSNIAKCERCHRLNKICEAQAFVPRKPRKRKPTRTAQLEEKLDGIVSLLTSTQRPTAPHDHTAGFPTPNKSSEGASPTTITNREPNQPSPLPWSRHAVPGVHRQETGFETAPVALAASTHGQEADQLISVFRAHMAPQFPFVVVPPRVRARELCAGNPFLYRAVVVVASCRDVAGQVVWRKDFMRHLCEQVLMGSQKSLDILQGLLVFIAWYHYHLPLPQLTNLVQLAIALSIDLGLNRPPKATERHEILVESTKCRSMRLEVRDRQLDERRAFLGLFWLTSVLSASLGIDPIKDTPYIEECCRTLKESEEYPSDEHLLHLVRLQQINEKIRPITVPAHGVDQPLAMYIKMLHAELRQFKESLLGDIEQNKVFASHYHGAEILLFELGFHKSSLATSSPESVLHQISLLHSCLESVKLFFETYISLPAGAYFTYTIGLFTQLSHAFIALSKLTLLEHDCWDISYVQQTVNLSEVLQPLAERFQEAGRGFDIDPLTKQHNDTFSRLARKIQRIKVWFDGRHLVNRGPEAVEGTIEESAVGVQFDLLDEAFWMEVMSDWDSLQPFLDL